jgi:hypothetical protein
MDISKLIAELHEERERLHEAIINLEKLTQAGTPRRGRPPAWRAAANVTAHRNRNSRNGSLVGTALSAAQS